MIGRRECKVSEGRDLVSFSVSEMVRMFRVVQYPGDGSGAGESGSLCDRQNDEELV